MATTRTDSPVTALSDSTATADDPVVHPGEDEAALPTPSRRTLVVLERLVAFEIVVLLVGAVLVGL